MSTICQSTSGSTDEPLKLRIPVIPHMNGFDVPGNARSNYIPRCMGITLVQEFAIGCSWLEAGREAEPEMEIAAD